MTGATGAGVTGVTGATGPAGSGGGGASTVDVNQVDHGFDVGDVIRNDGDDTYALAQADSEANAEVVGMVTEVADADNFTYATGGPVAGLAGLTSETVYYLSAATPGAITATEPSTAGQISKPIGIAIDTDELVFSHAYRGLIVGGTPSGDTLIEEIIVGSGGAASVDFQNIPQTYRHLRIVAICQTEDGSAQYLRYRQNARTTGYYSQRFDAAGGGSAVDHEENTTYGRIGILPETGATQMASVVIDVPYYTVATIHTMLSHFGGYWASANREGMYSGLQGTAEAITQLTFYSAQAGSDLKEGSRFCLYGVA